MTHAAFARALDHFEGKQAKLADAIGTSQQRISYIMVNKNPCPPDLVLKTERATGISRHELRPDLYPIEHGQAAA
jgi:DNA-binding transcriptional regulator YdaS (Cro superfamily)